MILSLLVACADEDGGRIAGVSGTVTAERVTDTTETVSAVVATPAAFAAVVDGTLALLLTPNAEATCADAGAWLRGGADAFSPEAVTPAGGCSIFVRAPYADDAIDVIDDPSRATVTLDCAMGEGSWIDGAYDGPWWVGAPDGFTLRAAEDAGGEVAVALEMSTYNGSFTRDTDWPDPDPATGAVAGETRAPACGELAEALGR